MDIGYILDTDIGPDCDDAAALALMAKQAGDKLLAVMHCTSSPWGVGAIRNILQWYGLQRIPVGTCRDADFLCGEAYERYNRALALEMSESDREAEDCVKLYRKILRDRQDKSVDIVSIGPLRNLGNVLRSQADDISDDTGIELVAKKVRRLVLMAGNFLPDSGAEWNVQMDIESARLLARDWRTEMVYCGFEVGKDVILLQEPHGLDASHPVARAYAMYTHGEGRSSWDVCTVQWALFSSPFYTCSPWGSVTIDENGVSRWRETPNRRQAYLSLNAEPQVVAEALYRLL